MKKLLQITGIEKSVSTGLRGDETLSVLAGVDFSLYGNEILGIVGPSGCGKSTLLRIIAGLDEQTRGEIRWHVTGENPISHFMVFQDYSRSLFPWFTVRKQLTYARDCIGTADPEESNEKIDGILALTGLADYAEMLPSQLSGGMKQRVALARALVLEPGVLLLDEPFGSLDAYNRYQLEDYLLKALKTIDIGMILVTHDLDEAVYLCNRIVVMGKKPSHVVEEITVPFEARDQISTKSDERFRTIRGRLFGLIEAAGFGVSG